MSAVISIPGLLIPPRKRIIVPCLRCGKPKRPWRSPLAWAMAHLKKNPASGHLIKSTVGHLVKRCLGGTFIEANICGGDTGANIWFQLNDDGTIYFPDTAGGISVVMPIYFSDGMNCYEVKVGNPTDAAPGGTIVTDVTTLDLKSGCSCLDDVDAFYAVRNCCTDALEGWVRQSDLSEWQTDNSTVTTTFVDAYGRCLYVDARLWSYGPVDDVIDMDDYSPADDCDDEDCTCCCDVFCCPNGTVITLTVSYTITHSGGSTDSGVLSASITYDGSALAGNFTTTPDVDHPFPSMQFFVRGCNPEINNGGMYVDGLSGVQTDSGVGAQMNSGHITPFGDSGSASGSFDEVFPDPPGGSGDWTASIEGC